MKKILFFLTILVTFTLSGCWDSVETEKLGVITLLGVELSDNDNIKLTVQEVSPKSPSTGSQSSGSAPQAPFYAYSEEGSTISEAIQKISSSQHKNIYLSHAKAIILDEEMVRSKGLKPVIDFYQRFPDMRLKTWLLISKSGQLDSILTTNTGLNTDTGTILSETIANDKVNSYMTVKNLKDFIEMLGEPGSEAYTSGVSISPRDASNKIDIKDTAIFKNDKMIGWLKDDESRGLSIANDNVKGGFMSIPFEDNVLSLRILKIASKVRPIINNGEMQINLNVKVLSNIAESQGMSDFLKEDTIEKVQQLQSEQIKNEITAALNKSKNLNSDIFEFGNYFNMYLPKIWKDIDDDWYSYYPNLQVNINVNTTVKNIGNNYKTLKY